MYSQQPCPETCPCVFWQKLPVHLVYFAGKSLQIDTASLFTAGLQLTLLKDHTVCGYMHQYCIKAVPFNAQLISDLSPTVNFSFCLHCPGNWELHFVIAFTSHGFIRSEKILSGLKKLQPSHQFRIYRMHFSCIMIIQVIYKSKEN